MASKKPKRPAKHPGPLKLARELVMLGRYRDTAHAVLRGAERVITLAEKLHVIQMGYHEPSKDEFKAEFSSWNYAIRGKTIDGRELRIAVSFEDGYCLLVIVTAIGLQGRP